MGDVALPPSLGPREGMGEVAFSDFVPLCWGFLRMQGSRSIPAVFCAPEKAGVRQPVLILFPYVWNP